METSPVDQDITPPGVIPLSVSAFIFDPDSKRLQVLDQTLLPKATKYVEIPDSESGHSAIKNMMVRGAPCIAAVGCLSIITELNRSQFMQLDHNQLAPDDLIGWLKEKSNMMLTSRPTAVNLKNALSNLSAFAECAKFECEGNLDLIRKLTKFCQDAIVVGETLNRYLGDFGARELMENVNDGEGITVLTHCNTGALATVGYGTALGVIRSLHNRGQLKHVYCTETRPYNQGSRLTAWELVKEKIPATLICDSMVAYLMARHKLDAVLVGADCVASNGDTANKIGTFQIALVAKSFGVPFYVAAPTQSIDLSIEDQSSIKIELRPSNEVRRIGDIVLAPDEIDVWNPSFDITPSGLISGIITELGVCRADKIREFLSDRNGSGNSGPQALF